MPKIKTHSGAKKRIKVSATGKMLRRRGGGNHFLGKKSGARKRGYAGTQEVSRTRESDMKKMIGVK